MKSGAALKADLLAVIRELAYADTLEQVTAIVRRAVRSVTGADGATFVIRDQRRVRYIDEDAIGPLWKGLSFDIDACVSGWCILNRRAIAIPDIYADARVPHDAYRATFVKSMAMAPIRSEEPIGAIGAYWGRRRVPGGRHVAALQALADAAAVAFVSLQRGMAGQAAWDSGRLPPVSLNDPPKRGPAEMFHRVIVIGSSAGGLPILIRFLRALPGDFSAPILLVIHMLRNRASTVARILDKAGALPVSTAHNGEPIRRGKVYVAPADHHLLISRGELRVVEGSEENFSRPAIDPLFRTAAQCYRQRVVAVLLSGKLYDGTAGLLSVKMHGGVTIVQNPDEAAYPEMCRTALKYVEADHVLSLAEIAALLPSLASTPCTVPYHVQARLP